MRLNTEVKTWIRFNPNDWLETGTENKEKAVALINANLSSNKLKIQEMKSKEAATQKKEDVITYNICTTRRDNNDWIEISDYNAVYGFLSKRNSVDEVT